MRTGFGNTKTRSSSVTHGDVIFLSDGKPFITLYQIRDPHGLSRIAKGVRKQTILVEKMLKKGTDKKISSDDESNFTCHNCSTMSVQGAKFCNNCGSRLK